MTRTALLACLLSLCLLPLSSPADPTYVGYTGKKWTADYGVIEGRCNTGAVGAVLGGEDRPVALILGSAIAAVVGHAIGNEMDVADRACMGHALELAGDRKTVVWSNAVSGVTYRLTPSGSFKDGNAPCRRFTTVVASGKRKETVKGAACRQPGGDWLFRP